MLVWGIVVACGSLGWKFIFYSISIIETSKLTWICGVTSFVCEEAERGENTGFELSLCGMHFQDGPSAGHDDVWSHIFHIKKTLPGYKHQDSSASCSCNMSAPTPQRRLANVGSLLLTPQENECLFNYLGRKCIVSSAFCDFASSSDGDSVLWSCSVWQRVSPVNGCFAARTC